MPASRRRRSRAFADWLSIVGISTHDYANEFSGARRPRRGRRVRRCPASRTRLPPDALAYFLGLHGPNASIDTACSSSSMAIHLAVQSLRGREANVALAGGRQSHAHADRVDPDLARAHDGVRRTLQDLRRRGRRLRARRRLRRLVLKRLSDARRDGDRILAVIRGSAVNQDGRSSGLTAPNGVAQEAVIREALANAGLAPDDIDVVEAHGTGTSLGDPIEINALAEGLRPARRRRDRSRCRSVKTNIGHTEGAAGIAGVIKTVLALQHEQIPPHLHLRTPNPLIAWSALPNQRAGRASVRGSRASGKPRRAGVSSFGFSGTNTHIVLEEAPAEAAVTESSQATPQLLVLSAQTATALRDHAVRSARLSRAARTPLRCATWRSPPVLDARISWSDMALVARDAATAAEQLDTVLASDEPSRDAGCIARPCAVGKSAGDRVPVHRAGRAALRHGARAVRDAARVSRGAGRVRRGCRSDRRPVARRT